MDHKPIFGSWKVLKKEKILIFVFSYLVILYNFLKKIIHNYN